MSSFRLPTVVSGITQSVTQFGNVVTGRVGDARYFQSTKKGEIQELKDDLHSTSKEKKKETVKKVIAAMTIGKDVSTLFPDVVNCMQTSNIELKKLVYLYVINYAKVQPELAVLAINTFRKDSLDNNPLIRALAVRTMGCIRLDQVVEYLLEPLRRACKDSDPYVRKTAATCICKLYDTSPEAVEDQGFMAILQDMLLDTNPTVVANAVASLTEISEASSHDYLCFSESIVSRLLTALGECSEWGQVFILDALASYVPPDSAAATSVLDRITARLSHANAAVVLSTIRIVIRMLDYVDDVNLVRNTQKKLGPPLVTLLSAENEVQYVALRNISLIVQKYPNILANEVKMFFCKYNDPHYVKMEKLEILIRLTTDHNVDQVLQELKEYATEVDVEFVRRTVRAIGRCAIKLERAAENCIAVLLSLIETRVNYVVQEAIIVMKDVFRKYPNRYESVISTLCENLISLDEPEAKAAMIWIIGEYAQRIENADELLESFLDSFHDEPISVRQQILTATVKLFLKCPTRSQELVTRVLKLSTEETDDPDLRDRGFIYWRLLSTDPEATKSVVLSQKPVISEESFYLEPEVLDKLLQSISTLASVFHRVPESFVTRLRTPARPAISESSEESIMSDGEEKANPAEIKAAISAAEEYHSDEDEAHETASSSASSSSTPSDLLDLKEDSSNSEDGESSTKAKKGGSSLKTSPLPSVQEWPIILTPTTAGTNGKTGVGIRGYIKRQEAQTMFHLSVTNQSGVILSSQAWAIQINKNSFGIAAQNGCNIGLPDLQPHQTAETAIPLSLNVNLSQTPPPFPLVLQVAIRTSLDVFYLAPVPFDISTVFVSSDTVDTDVFRTHWQRMGAEKQTSFMGVLSNDMSADAVSKMLEAYQFRFIIAREQDTFSTIYMSAVTANKLLLLFEVSIQKGGRGIKVSMRADAGQMFPILQDFFVRALKIQQPRNT